MLPKSNETLDYALKIMEQQRKEDREITMIENQINRDEHKKLFDIVGIIKNDNKATKDMISNFINSTETKFVKQKEFDKFKSKVINNITLKTILVKGMWGTVTALIGALGARWATK